MYIFTPKYSLESNEFGCGLGNIEGRKKTFFQLKIIQIAKGSYIKYVGGGPKGFCGGHETF